MDLEYPLNAAELYLARGENVSPGRPIIQGDVFPNVCIPGVDDTEDGLAMVCHHPCSMRQGAVLVDRLKMVRLRARAPFPLSKQGDGFFGVLALPNVRDAEADSFHVAVLDELGRVLSSSLDVRDRIACLSPKGLMLLQQRMVFADTRVLVHTDTLMERSESVLAETELLEEWNEDLMPEPTADNFLEALEEEAKAFDNLLSTKQSGEDGEEYTLREALRKSTQRSFVRTEVRRFLAERKSNPTNREDEKVTHD